jgi:fumarate reductase subunit C
VIPLPQIVAEIIMALGGALLAANVWALLQPRLRPEKVPAKPVNRGRAVTNAIIGLVVLAWGFASFLTR